MSQNLRWEADRGKGYQNIRLNDYARFSQVIAIPFIDENITQPTIFGERARVLSWLPD